MRLKTPAISLKKEARRGYSLPDILFRTGTDCRLSPLVAFLYLQQEAGGRQRSYQCQWSS